MTLKFEKWYVAAIWVVEINCNVPNFNDKLRHPEEVLLIENNLLEILDHLLHLLR